MRSCHTVKGLGSSCASQRRSSFRAICLPRSRRADTGPRTGSGLTDMPAENVPLFGEMRWNSAELAEALLLTQQRVTQLSREHILPHAVDGLYKPIESVSSYIRYLRQREAGKSQAGESIRKVQLENEMRSVKLKRIAGELVPLDRVQKDFFEMARRVRDGLLNLPSRLSGVFAAEASQDKIFELFTKEVHAVLTELSSGQAAQQNMPLLPLEEPAYPERSPDETEARGDAAALGRESDNLPHPPACEDAFLDRGDEDPDDRFSTGD